MSTGPDELELVLADLLQLGTIFRRNQQSFLDLVLNKQEIVERIHATFDVRLVETDGGRKVPSKAAEEFAAYCAELSECMNKIERLT